MEKWKVAVIIALIACLGIYGVAQQRASQAGPTTPAMPETPEPPPPVKQLKGKSPIAWQIPAQYWYNTPRPLILSDFKGSVTLMEFWRTGCPHCQDAAPFMAHLYRAYSPRGLKMVTFQSPIPSDTLTDEEGNWGDVKSFVRDNNLPYPVAFDNKGVVFKAYQGTFYPTVIVIDRAGIIRFVETGYDAKKQRALEAFIIKALGISIAKTPAAKPALHAPKTP